jgi:RND family efflux transporter MFP subunit
MTQTRSASEGYRLAIYIAVGLAGAVVMAAGCGGPVVADHAQPPGAQAGGGALEVVLAGPPVRKTLTFVSTQPARVEAIEQTPIHSKLAGYVAEVLVDYGDEVRAGQPLVKLSVPEMEVDVVQKQALIDQAKSEVEQAEAGKVAAESAVTTAESKVAQAKALVARNEADIERWQSEFARYEKLVAGGSVNQQLLDETKQKLRAAEAGRTEAEAGIAAADAALAESRSGVVQAESDIAAAKARERVAQANLQHAQTLLAYAEIKAPFAGVITKRGVDPGHYVQPAGSGASPLMVVARTKVARIFVAVPELEAGYVDVGDEVTIAVQSLRGVEFPGKVTRTSAVLDDASRSLLTIIDIDNADGRLRPGTFATARIKLDEHSDVLTLPSAAVVRQDKEAFCYRLIEGKAAKTLIHLGLRVGDDWEIASGLAEGDTVILNKASTLKDAQPVEVLKPAS